MREQTRFVLGSETTQIFHARRERALHNSKLSQELEGLNSGERASGRGENINQVGP